LPKGRVVEPTHLRVSREPRRPAGVLLFGIVAAMCEAAVMAFPPNKTVSLSIDVTALMPMRALQLNAMVSEVTALWVPHGISFTWITTPLQGGPSSVIPLVRVIDDGCRLARVWAPAETGLCTSRGSAQPVGTAIFVEGKATPEDTLFVSVNRVAQIVAGTPFADRPAGEWPSGVHDNLVGRALGRVLAHELGHYLLGMREHSPDGLMQPLFRGDLLIGRDRRMFELPKGLLSRLRARLEVLASQTECATRAR
jgi:hypothetical protein